MHHARAAASQVCTAHGGTVTRAVATSPGAASTTADPARWRSGRLRSEPSGARYSWTVSRPGRAPVLRALQDAGSDVPGDAALVGADDLMPARLLRP
ncbi:hypothetical protein [Kitasatospora sp. DSM 101779]|uniref:hypothetical protein n=1 Tax=Kitasatospora sp. DSM 101779 TaxID=2853165 RepID=UPI003987FB82